MLPQVAWQTATHAKRVMVYATQTVKSVQPFYVYQLIYRAVVVAGAGGGQVQPEITNSLPRVTRCQEVHIRRNEVAKLC